MNLAKAILFFYLMFPTFSPQQELLIQEFGKEEITVEKKQKIISEIKAFLNPQEILDSTDEINTEIIEEDQTAEELILNEEDIIFDGEDIPLPGDLENPQYEPQSAGSSLLDSENTEEKNENIAEKQYINSLNRLSLFKYGEEQFNTNEKYGKKKTLVTVNSDFIIRVRYDDEFYVKDRITWKNAATVNASTLISKVEYKYGNSTEGKKIVIGKKEEYVPEKKLVETSYDDYGNPVKVVYYHFEEDKAKYDELVKAAEEKFIKENPKPEPLPAEKIQTEENTETSENQSEENKQKEEAVEVKDPVQEWEKLKQNVLASIEMPLKKFTDKTTKRTFDSKNRILTEEEITAYEIPDPRRRGIKMKTQASKKNVYTYTLKSSVPDFIFYENGKMRMAVNYIDEDTYEQTMYFENQFLIKTSYSHGRKTQEVFYSGATEIKRTKFE